MAACLSLYRCDIMNLFFLGYLYFNIAINPVKSSDWPSSFEITEKYIDLQNCTQCTTQQESSCFCFETANTCSICCPGVPCCSCYDCTPCWHEQRRLITMTQICISIVLGFGFLGWLIIYCKICKRTRREVRHARCIVLQQERDRATNFSTIEDLRERPPSYNEVICSAPPLYTSPYNRASMQEAPPSYPGTPKPQERSQGSNELSSSPPITQHI